MNLLYATPLALTFHYLTLWFYGTSMDTLVSQFYEADRQNIDLTLTSQSFIEEFDFIVVGAGSSGSALAARLSENASHRVLLLEVGSNPFPLTSVPSMTFMLLDNPNISFTHKLAPQKRACQAFEDEGVTFHTGKGLGGTSNLNVMIAMRGNPHDYDRWAELANNSKWRFENILPFFKKIETYRGNFPSDYHGTDGPLHVEPNLHAPLQKEWLQIGKELGYPIKDPNGAEQSQSFFPLDITTKNGTRCSTHRAYLFPVLNRQNLVILPYATATKIELDSSLKAVGVHFDLLRNGKKFAQFAKTKKEIILSAGALGSPKLLMLSGIGPKDHLKKMKIPLKIDLPVGQSFQDHLFINVGPFSFDKEKTISNLERNFSLQAVHQYLINQTGRLSGTDLGGGALIASSFTNESWPDLYYNFHSHTMTPTVSKVNTKLFGMKAGILESYFRPMMGKDVFFTAVILGLPKSTGQVLLKSKSPYDSLDIDPNYLSHPDDVTALLEGIDLALKMSLETEVMKNIEAKLTPGMFPGCESFGNSTRGNVAYWKCYLEHWSQTTWHYASTCKMGRGPSDSVVDSNLRVHGVTGLRVVDNSIAPRVVSTNTNLPAILIGEKGADIIKQFWS